MQKKGTLLIRSVYYKSIFKLTMTLFHVLLTVHLSMILVINQLNAQILNL